MGCPGLGTCFHSIRGDRFGREMDSNRRAFGSCALGDRMGSEPFDNDRHASGLENHRRVGYYRSVSEREFILLFFTCLSPGAAMSKGQWLRMPESGLGTLLFSHLPFLRRFADPLQSDLCFHGPGVVVNGSGTIRILCLQRSWT